MLKAMYSKMKARGQLMKAMKAGGIFLKLPGGDNGRYRYPTIHDVDITDKYTRYVITLPNGLHPDKLKEGEFALRQVLGHYVEIIGKVKRFTITVHRKGMPDEFAYNYKEVLPHITEMELPIIVGRNIYNQYVAFDISTYPHLLLTGETGSGKSSLLRAALCTLIQYKNPSDLRLILGDMKMSEFGIYRRIPHVQDICMDAKSLLKALLEVRKELKKRGKLLEQFEVNHISELSFKLPWILVCIDEVALLKKEKEIMQIIEDISSIGRSLGILLALSCQRADAQLLDGKLKNNLTVRLSGRQSNETNSRVAGVPGAHEIDISQRGRMILVLEEPTEVQSPFLSNEQAKKILAPFKVNDVVQSEEKPEPNVPTSELPTENDIFNQINEGDVRND
jgi:DNA segregation ATPase FtsK/SpoIIIE, S-DNA-T family